MATFNIIDIMNTKPRSFMEVEFDNLWIPHWTNFLSPADVENLRYIVTSKKYSGNMNLKYKLIDNIMKSRGFRRFSGGTNRLVYRYLEDQTFLAKIAVDRVGMSDNPSEYANQFMLKPYCSKMFYITPCGTVGFAERVMPITSIGEFKLIAKDVYNILQNKIIGKYIIEDIGTKFYMNWGIRKGFGPVLLDYPYIFELDGSKIFCRNRLANGFYCGGEIDYDKGMNQLICTRCGKIYNASDLKKDKVLNNIVIRKGGTAPMNVQIIKGGNVVAHRNSSDIIRRSDRATSSIRNHKSTMQVSIVKGGNIIKSTGSPMIQSTTTLDLPESEPESVNEIQVEQEEIKSVVHDEQSVNDVQTQGVNIESEVEDTSNASIPQTDSGPAVISSFEEVPPEVISVPPQFLRTSITPYKADVGSARRITVKSGFIDDKIDTGDY